MDEKMKERRGRGTASVVTVCVILALPFVFFSWSLPFVSDQSVGGDVQRFVMDNQLELMFSVETGSFPLYAPGFAGGNTTSALTLGQIYHPIFQFCRCFPQYWRGAAVDVNMLFRLLTLGIAHLALYHLLRRIKVDRGFAFAIALVTVYNLKLLELFRYGASVESWTGHVFLCVALGFLWLRSKFAPWLVVLSTYWLVCGGHPQIMYYGLVGSGLFAFFFPHVHVAVSGGETSWRTVARFYGLGAFCVVGGIVLSAAYLLPFYFDFVLSNFGHVGEGYQWANMYPEPLLGVLNNFFVPYYSDVHGVFGGSPLILIAVLSPGLFLVGRRVPLVIWGLFLVVALCLCHMLGGMTPVHYLIWRWLPFASAMRGPGRASMVLPALLMLMLVWLVKSSPPSSQGKWKGFAGWSGWALVGTVALALSVIYVFIPQTPGDHAPILLYCPANWYLRLMLVVNLMIIGAMIVYCPKGRRNGVVGLIFCALTCFGVDLHLRFGNNVEKKRRTPTFETMRAEKRESLAYRPCCEFGYYSTFVAEQISRSFLEPFLAKTYGEATAVGDVKTMYARMAVEREPDTLFIDRDFPNDGVAFPHEDGDRRRDKITLIYSAFNRLVFEVFASAPGYFEFSYPNCGRWRAYVNGKRALVRQANGHSHAIQIPSGRMLVEWRYFSPGAFWGMVTSCVSLIVIGAWFCFERAKGAWTALSFSCGWFIFVSAGFFLWWLSLYGGENLGCKYIWRTSPKPTIDNLAYGKLCGASSLWYGVGNHLCCPSRAVDGVVASSSGFSTGYDDCPGWSIDLARRRLIGAVKIYETATGDDLNQRPLMIAFSDDKKHWRSVILVEDDNPGGLPLLFRLRPAVNARYMMIRSLKKCRLAFDEVEIHPPVGE